MESLPGLLGRHVSFLPAVVTEAIQLGPTRLLGEHEFPVALGPVDSGPLSLGNITRVFPSMPVSRNASRILLTALSPSVITAA